MTRASMLMAQCAPVALVAAVVAVSVFAAVVTVASFAADPSSSVARGEAAMVACRFAPS